MKKKYYLHSFIVCPILMLGQICSPISTLDCSQIEQSIPIELDFSVNNSGLSESGFTMILEPSSELTSDEDITDLNITGYAPSLISRDEEGLTIKSTKGILYNQPNGEFQSSDTNSQINALGIGITSPNATFSVISTFDNPDFSLSSGNNSQQGGIWYGIGEDHYVKLCVIKTDTNTKKIQLLLENLDNTTTTIEGAFTEINTGNLVDSNKITLRLELDPVSHTVKGYYSLDNEIEVLVSDLIVGDEISVPSDYFEGIVYDGVNTNNLLSFAGVFATHYIADIDQPIDMTFNNFKVDLVPENKILSFSENTLSFTGTKGMAIESKSVTVSSTSGNPTFILSEDPNSVDWLVLPQGTLIIDDNTVLFPLGEVELGIVDNLPTGTYNTTLFAINQPDSGFTNASIEINLEIIEPSKIIDTKINFTNSSTSESIDYEIDSGLGYGNRDNGLTYGWVSIDDGTPLDLSNRTRNRNISDFDIFQNTLIHMQYDDVLSTGEEGKWEIEVPEGVYSISVGVGDLFVDSESTTPSHNINIEGVNIINNFVSTGSENTATRLTIESSTVVVNDGKLTIDAIGGFNTKINYVEIITLEGIQIPKIVSLEPIDGSVSVPVNTSITTTNLFLPNRDSFGSQGLDESSVTTETIKLYKQEGVLDKTEVVIGVNIIEDSIVITPLANLEFDTTYVVEINNLLDITGEPFEFFMSTFTTESGSLTFEPIKINFSLASDVPPTDYLVDFGLGYGDRDNGYNYGWLNNDSSFSLDLSNRARNRNISGVDLLQNTLIHMQFNDIISSGQEGVWEIEVPNGIYDITVSVGDPLIDSPNNFHNINAEGINIINGYTPVGILGDADQFFSETNTVNVIDGNLTIDAVGGFNTKINSIEIVQVGSIEEPLFTGVSPANNAVNVTINSFQINVNVVTPTGYELNNRTLAGNINLYELIGDTEVLVPSNSNDTGGGDAITLTPTDDLKEFTTYVFRLTSDIKANVIGDVTDSLAFLPFESKFTTGVIDEGPIPTRDLTDVSFTRVNGVTDLGEGVDNEHFSSLVIGPDRKLYGSTIGDFVSDGKIYRWDMNTDGTLTNLEILSPVLDSSPHPVTGEEASPNRLIIGLAFDPASTADNLIAYITHSAASLTDGPEWDGKLTRLSGPTLSTVEDILIHLPRSAKDHLTNSIIFDENRDAYISQGSNSAGGEPDDNWALRPERLLTAAVLKLELDKLPDTLPLSVYTTDDISVINNAPSDSLLMSDGTYNPYSFNSPLTIFSTGVRNAYDMIWHSNGWMYIPTNGTAGNGNTSPNSPSTVNYPLAKRIDGLTSISSVPALLGGETQKDWLFKTRGGSYHGHPNPYRGEFILNHGGMSYSGLPGQEEGSYVDVFKYSSSLGPDVNYLEPAYDFGFNKSPNGSIEYKSNAFEGKLQGLIMVTRFSGQDDLLVMDPQNDGDISEVYNSISGLGGFDDPLDIVEDLKTGNLYISEYDRSNDGIARLTLLRAAIPATDVEILASPDELIFEVTTNDQGVNMLSRDVVISNEDSSTPLEIIGVSISGPFAEQFGDIQSSEIITSINPGESVTYSVTFAPELNSEDLGYQEASLVFESNDLINPTFEVGLHGLKKSGFEGNNEPTLESIVNTLGIGIDVGWTTLSNGTNPDPIGDEIEVERWLKASSDLEINITPVGRYSSSGSLPFGWYTNEDSIITNEVGVLANDLENAQTLFPEVESGNIAFDPEGEIFGIYVESETFNRLNYTEDAINTGGIAHRTRIYPMSDRQGNLIENSYLITFEDSNGIDYQDYMFIIDNVIPYEEGILELSFDNENLQYNIFVNQDNVPTQKVTISTNGAITAQEISLVGSEDWLILPSSFNLDEDLELGINSNDLSVGVYEATVMATAPNYISTIINVTLTVTPDYTYQFNFVTSDVVGASPEGYIDDFGAAYTSNSTILGDLTYGWVQKDSLIPEDASVNARNRNTGGSIDDVLLNTFIIIGQENFEVFPTLDWVVNIPNGKYYVNISVGDSEFSDSYHFFDVNGVTVIDFDQENNNPDNLSYFSTFEIVEVLNGVLRLSLKAGGVNGKVNYIQIDPIDTSLLTPTITANFDGILNSTGVYRGTAIVSLEANDNSGSGISSLQFTLDSDIIVDYDTPIEVVDVGDHVLTVNATDVNGNITIETYAFKIEEALGAVLGIENMTKIPGTQRGFPANDYYTFYNLGNTNVANVHDSNIMRLNNTGTSNLNISEINISDINNFTYQLFSEDGVIQTLPISIEPGSYADVDITFIGITGIFNAAEVGFNGVFKENIEIVSDADNAEEQNTAILHGGYAPRPENTTEINVQQIFDLFGFQSNSLSLVNEDNTIQPLNSSPVFPGAILPTDENVNNGYEGDMILSQTFVQADDSQPVIGIQLGAFHGGPASDGASFRNPNSNSVVGGMNFLHEKSWYSTVLPKQNDGNINFDSTNLITEPFRIQLVNYTTSGFTNNSGQEISGVRVYKVIDNKGNVISNEYIVTQDYVGQGGCAPGSGGCDYNDNVFYFINIKPEIDPSALAVSDASVLAEELFVLNLEDYIDQGYPGNEFEFTIAEEESLTLPSWVIVNNDSNIVAGTPPIEAIGESFSLNVSVIDLNGVVVNTIITVNIESSDNVAEAKASFSSEALNDSIVVQQEENQSIELLLYPNPASEIVNIALDDTVILSEINIFDTTGKKVMSFNKEKIKDVNKYALDVSTLQNGTYIINVIDVNKTAQNVMLVINK